MFHRKIEKRLEQYFVSGSDKILLIDGARQIGKSFIIRHVGKKYFSNYIEINLMEDREGFSLYDSVHSVEEFYLQLSATEGSKLGSRENTLIFLDEIQVYPALLTLLKFLRQDNRFTYIASGSMLGVALRKTASIPMGSIETVHMYPMDFEEFLLANGSGTDTIKQLRAYYEERKSLPEMTHRRMMEMFRYYLICGGLPDAVKAFVEEKNIASVRAVQAETHQYYAEDASQYSLENRLKIRAIYDGIPSLMENRKKRVVVSKIENKKGKTFEDYQDEFEYLSASGIALDVTAISTPVYPLTQVRQKNLLKLYLNDPGMLTGILYGNNIRAVLDDRLSINLGSVYECAVASELKAHGYNLYYYDNRKKGEVDFLIEDDSALSVLPLEIKSGKDYTTHAALDRFLANADYTVPEALVFSNDGTVRKEGKITYLPIYMIMFLEKYCPETDKLPDFNLKDLF